MKNFQLKDKKILKKDIKVSFKDSARILAEFFNGVVVKLEE